MTNTWEGEAVSLTRFTNMLIKLTSTNYWQELEELGRSGQLPYSLADHLKGLVCIHLRNTCRRRDGQPYIPYTHSGIDPQAVREAIRYLQEGIVIDRWDLDDEPDSHQEVYYQVYVWIPHNPQTHITHFQLVECHPKGSLTPVAIQSTQDVA